MLGMFGVFDLELIGYYYRGIDDCWNIVCFCFKIFECGYCIEVMKYFLYECFLFIVFKFVYGD